MTIEIDKKGTGRHTDASPIPIKLKENSMKVKMKSTQRSAVDGINLQEYGKGRQYDIPEGVAQRFIRKGWAVAVKVVEEEPPNPPEESPEEKVKEPDEAPVIDPPEQKEDEPEVNKDELDGSRSQGGEQKEEEPPVPKDDVNPRLDATAKADDGLKEPKDEKPPEPKKKDKK